MVRMDLEPLRRSREFRLLFVGQGVSFFGTMVTYVAVPYQAYRISHSSLIVGLLSLTELLPLLITAFVGGALADSVDRRRMVRLTESAMCLVTGALVLNSLASHPRLWVLFVVAFAGGRDRRPATAIPRRDGAEARGSSRSSRLPPPSPRSRAISVWWRRLPIAGVLIVAVGLPATYGVDVATFVVSLVALSMMRAVPPPPESEGLSLRAIVEGLRYARSRQDLLGTYLVDMNAMFFGMPTALVPAGREPSRRGCRARRPLRGAFGRLADRHPDERVGAPRPPPRPRGCARGRRSGDSGSSVSVSRTRLFLAVIGLVVAGGADMVSGLFRTTMWNQSIPDSLRGRLAGIEMLSYSSGPTLGNVEAGARRISCRSACLHRLRRRALRCGNGRFWLPCCPVSGTTTPPTRAALGDPESN